MTLKVRVSPQQATIIVRRENDGTINPNKGDVVVRPAPLDNRLDQLNDVEEGTSPEDGATLAYDEFQDKYIVRKLTIGDIDEVNLDGGEF